MKALYPGTFDPVTNGHLDIIKRAVSMFDEVIVAVSGHGRKDTMFSLAERCQLLTTVLADMPTVSVVGFTNLAVEAAEQQRAGAIIRGLRVMSDFEYEFTMAKFMADQNSNIHPVYLMADAKFTHISSTAVRELAKMGSNIDKYVPSSVATAIQQKTDEVTNVQTAA
ncbi:MAG: pantetheine-phosphate adenylyltransferase [Alphaproteobacteria bacterium]|nr:pantetheine-phosphate adenylyltransferase [Alphaproteobacteria bacterium]MDD9919183.1 pantetheine-phosphate adenylyltransferase [Alphaproteobacteria bacterium]